MAFFKCNNDWNLYITTTWYFRVIVYIPWHTLQRSKDNLWRLVLFFYHVGSGDRALILRLVSKHLTCKGSSQALFKIILFMICVCLCLYVCVIVCVSNCEDNLTVSSPLPPWSFRRLLVLMAYTLLLNWGRRVLNEITGAGKMAQRLTVLARGPE